MTNPVQNPNHELVKYMRRIADANKKRNVIIRGLINGVATAIGATFGFAVVLFITGVVFSNLKQVPVIDRIIKDTGIGIIIENELNKIKAEDAGVIAGEGETEPDEPTYVKYTNADFDITFDYPISFTSFNEFAVEVPEGSKSAYNINMEGSGSLQKLSIFINPVNFEIIGDYIDEPVEVFEYANIALLTYHEGASLNGKELTSPVYFLQVENGENHFFFVGEANTDKPRLAKEIMTDLLKTVESVQ